MPVERSSHELPVDSDVDLHLPEDRRSKGTDPVLLSVIALGGVLGAWARYGMSQWFPHEPDKWPTSTLLVNISGCFLLGALMITLLDLTNPHPLLRPFLGIGVLGGYTTFSTASVEVQQLITDNRVGVALLYMATSATSALVAVGLGVAVMRVAGRLRDGRRDRRLTAPDAGGNP